ncbi:MAG TPA: site-2 protease family protein [Thermoplasmata archaeon]|nr:site-2 protease family protein [Thermoplasmata archaeon]
MSSPLPGTPSAANEIERLKSWVAAFFPVYETRITPASLVLLVHADPATLEERFDGLRRDLWEKFYIPQVRYERGEYVIEVVRRPMRRPWGLAVNLALLVITIASTVTAGAFLWLAYVGGSSLGGIDFLDGGVTFAFPLLAILGVHELAHYALARRHHVEASLPFFIPVPPPFLLFGTFGAFISLREPIPDKKALLDIGASGPLAGFALAIPVTVYGMFLSAHAPVLSLANCGPSFLGVSYANFVFGPSLIWSLIGAFVPVSFVNLSPVALAGWVGILVTAINLLPAGQLDGGHVFRALLGDRTRWVSYAAVGLLLVLGLFYEGWFIFAFLILLLGIRHPPPLNDLTRLDAKRWAVGGLAIVVLVGGFVIVPIASPSGAFAVTNPATHPGVGPPAGGIADTMTFSVADQDLIGHAYVVNGSVVKVVGSTGNGTSAPLSGAALAAYLANSSWTVVLPNGNTSLANGHGSFTLPADQYAAIDAGTAATFQVTYANPVQATVVILVTVNEVCAIPGAGPQTETFTIY